jgi:hypothetical protein
VLSKIPLEWEGTWLRFRARFVVALQVTDGCIHGFPFVCIELLQSLPQLPIADAGCIPYLWQFVGFLT